MGGCRWSSAVIAVMALVALADPATAKAEQDDWCGAPEYGEVTDVRYGELDPLLERLGGATVDGEEVDDPLFPHQWNLATLNVPAAWSAGATGAGVTIAVLDSGADFTHPDLQGKLLPGKAFLSEKGFELAGKCPVMDRDGHGTTVAGLAGAATGNGIGLAGVAPRAKILPIAIYDPPGGEAPDELDPRFTSRLAAAFRYATRHADVINLSGGQLTDNAAIRDAVLDAVAAGKVVVSIAHNVPQRAITCHMPGRLPGVVCVSGLDRRGNPTPVHALPVQLDPGGIDPANPAVPHPTVNGGVPLRAPTGVDVSANGARMCDESVAGHPRPVLSRREQLWVLMRPNTRPACQPYAGYAQGGQTSQSSPQVAGIAALLLEKGLSAAEVVECLRTTSSRDGEYDPVWGYGVPDAGRAVRECTATGR